MDRGLLAALRQREAGQVLPPDAAGTQTTGQRTIKMGGLLPRHGIDSESGKAGGAMNSFIRKLMWLAQRRRREAELRQELEFHLDEEAEEGKDRGLPHEQARWAAHRDLGNMTRVEENVRGVWIWRFWEHLLQDLRYGGRMMRKSPAFTLLAALSLALGIGANTAIYSFMDSLLLRSLPVPDPASLVVLQWHSKPQ